MAEPQPQAANFLPPRAHTLPQAADLRKGNPPGPESGSRPPGPHAMGGGQVHQACRSERSRKADERLGTLLVQQRHGERRKSPQRGEGEVRLQRRRRGER